MGIRETIVEHFGEDDYVVQEMNERGLDWGIILAKSCIDPDNNSLTAKAIRAWHPPNVLEVPEEPAVKPLPMRRVVHRERSIPRYTVEEYRQLKRPSFWQRVREVLLPKRDLPKS